MTIPGTVINGVIVLDTPQQLPEGTRVEVVVQEPTPQSAETTTTLAQRLLRLAETVDDLPNDMVRNHDHYIHGAPKR